MRRNPLYVFADRMSAGIFEVPLKSIVHIIDGDNLGTTKYVELIAKTGLNSSSTIGVFLDNPSLYEEISKEFKIENAKLAELGDVEVTNVTNGQVLVWDEVGQVWTPGDQNTTGELEKITEGGNTGWRLAGRDPALYGNIGNEATDFSFQNGQVPNGGATGPNSSAEGFNTSATGVASHAEGQVTSATGYASHAEGQFTVASGSYGSHAEGYQTIAQNHHMHAEGKYNVGTSMETIHETGIGIDNTDRRNAFEIYTDGRIRTPELTVALHDNPRSLVTKEYVDLATAGAGNLYSDGSVQMDTGYVPAVDLDIATKEYVDIFIPSNIVQAGTGSVRVENFVLITQAAYDLITPDRNTLYAIVPEAMFAWISQQEINNPTPAAQDRFGYPVSLYGDTLVVGALGDDTGATDAGSVYVYIRTGSTWTLQQEINNPTPATNDWFGDSISLYQDTLVVGADGDDTGANGAGSVYIYIRTGSTWTLQQEINNPVPVTNDNFGWLVSLYQDTLVVGTGGDDTGAEDAGSCYVYTRAGSTWTLQQKINNPTPAEYDYFGYPVSLYENTLAVGAYDDTGAEDAGSVYVYTRVGSTWTLQQTISNPSPAVGDNFGENISLYQDTLVVGASQDDTGAEDAGSVYVYTRTGSIWTLQQTINNPSPTSFDYFGNSVSLYGDTLVAFISSVSTGENSAGSVCIYKRTDGVWSLQQEINNPTPAMSDNFGYPVSLYENTLAVAARNDDTGASDTGSVYVYHYEEI